MPQRVEVPALVREHAMRSGGEARAWLAELPGMVAALSDRWGLEPGAALEGGTASYVVAATDSQGRPCVLKVAMPRDMDDGETFARSARVHHLAAGHGCVELFAYDESARAMLLERLGPNLSDLGLPLPRLLEAIATTLRSFWRPIPEDVALPSGAEKAAWLARYITTSWDELGRPCDRDVIDRAVAYCDGRAAAFDPSRAVLVHGDAHGWNTLEASHGSYKFVDPEGLRSEPEHDLAAAMREYNHPLLAGDTARLARERAEVLAAHCGVDPQAVWEWGFIERVATGLANLGAFDSDDGAAFLEAAKRCL